MGHVSTSEKMHEQAADLRKLADRLEADAELADEQGYIAAAPRLRKVARKAIRFALVLDAHAHALSGGFDGSAMRQIDALSEGDEA